MTKDELIEIAKKRYFEGNKRVEFMYASADGNFFHAHAKNYALNHVSGKDIELFKITREEVEGKVKPSKEVKEVKEEAETVVEVSSETASEDEPKTKPKKKGKKQ